MRGVHRRPVRRAGRREPKVLTEPMRQAVRAWRQADEQAPPKHRHPGRRV
jgi:hypothetical protein